MRTQLQFTLGLVVILILDSGCSHLPWRQSCANLRRFDQFTGPTPLYRSLKAVDVTTLSPEVRDAVALAMRKLRAANYSFEIVAAKVTGEYLLLTVRGPCFDCDRGLVYSTRRKCVVGLFFFMQG